MQQRRSRAHSRLLSVMEAALIDGLPSCSTAPRTAQGECEPTTRKSAEDESVSSCCRSVFLCLALLLCASAAILATGSYCSLRPLDIGIPEFRMMPPGGGGPVLWPNGNPPRNPSWPLVGVVGGIAINEPHEPTGSPATGGPKPPNWCGTEYIWTGPRPKSPKELILTPVIPRPR
jgi:hypothetical protein